MVAKHLIPKVPAEQLQSPDQYRYTSAIYINVLLRHWRPIVQLGVCS